MENKKDYSFQLQDLLPIAMIFVVTVIGIAFGLNIVSDVQSDFVTGATGCNATDKSSCGAEYAATGDGITAIAKITEKLPLVATVVIAAVLIGILVRYLFVKFV